MKLSDLKCRKSSAGEKLLKLSDGDGLFLHVYPNGRKLWRLSYRHAGKQRDLPFGPYPAVSLVEAREKRHEAKKLLREGKDPGAQKKAEEAAAAAREETTFAAFADLYLDRLAKTGRSAPTIKKAKWIVEDLAKDLSAQQVADITPRDVLRALRVIEANATPKRDYYLVSRDGCRLFELGLGPATLAFVGASRPEDHTLMDRVLSEASGRGFAAAWLDARGLRDAAGAVRRFNTQTQMQTETQAAALADAK